MSSLIQWGVRGEQWWRLVVGLCWVKPALHCCILLNWPLAGTQSRGLDIPGTLAWLETGAATRLLCCDREWLTFSGVKVTVQVWQKKSCPLQRGGELSRRRRRAARGRRGRPTCSPCPMMCSLGCWATSAHGTSCRWASSSLYTTCSSSYSPLSPITLYHSGLAVIQYVFLPLQCVCIVLLFDTFSSAPLS